MSDVQASSDIVVPEPIQSVVVGTDLIGVDTGVVASSVLEVPDAADDFANFVVMVVGAVTFELPSTNPIVELIEESIPYRSMTFPVGLTEAQSLALAIARIDGVRPSTHELFTQFLVASRSDIVAVRIVKRDRGVLFAELDLVGPNGRTVLDCRPSDALILAFRQGVVAPILCDDVLL